MVDKKNSIPTSIAIICDANKKKGFGHYSRCKAVAQPLHATYGWNVIFVMRNSSVVEGDLKRYPYNLHNKKKEKDYLVDHVWYQKVIKDEKVSVVLLDITTNLPFSFFKNLRKKNIKIASIDDPTTNRLHCDLVFYPPSPQVSRMEWPEFRGIIKHGWQWVPLKKQFILRRKARGTKGLSGSERKLKLLVSMGGSDPHGLIFLVLNAIAILDLDIDVLILLGPAFMHKNKLTAYMKKTKKKYKIFSNKFEVDDIFSSADFAIASFGVTAYELTSIGVPSIYISISEQHNEVAELFHKEKLAVNLGIFNNLTKEKICRELLFFGKSKENRDLFSKKCLAMLDCYGSQRIAKEISELVEC